MSEPLPTRVVGDLSSLPDSETGNRHLVWWGNIGFMAIEGTAFALAIGTYLYLATQTQSWPPAGVRPPDLLWSAIFTVGLMLSELPNRWVCRKSTEHDERGVRLGVLLMSILALALLAVRGVELRHLNISWDDNAYGSVVWMLMILHTSHILTDWVDTVVQAVWLFTHEVGDDQFADVEDNANYWSFVVYAWIPIYALLYWFPRLL
jgi:cytochrome c oxidase subunit 3